MNNMTTATERERPQTTAAELYERYLRFCREHDLAAVSLSYLSSLTPEALDLWDQALINSGY